MRNPVRVASAIARFTKADRALAAYERRARSAGVTEETDEFLRLNRAVDRAYWDRDLPDCHRDPADKGHHV